jgi:IS30 family transposase
MSSYASRPACRSTSVIRSPWQRATNQNTTGLLRQYFPRGTDLGRFDTDDLAAVADALNSRPRKTLGWHTPAEVLNEHLLAGASTTPFGVVSNA